jgi:hypothetical protein
MATLPAHFNGASTTVRRYAGKAPYIATLPPVDQPILNIFPESIFG